MTASITPEQFAILAARVAELEAREACRCSSCTEIKRERERVRLLESWAEITRMPPADRAVAIDAMGSRRRAYFLFLGAEVIATVNSAPDPATRARWAEEVEAHYRDILDLEDVVIPHWIRLVPAAVTFGWQRSAFEVSRDQARRLISVGLAGGLSGGDGLVEYLPTSWISMVGFDVVLSAEQLAVLLDVDKALAERIDRGQILAIDYTAEMDRQAVLESWRRIPRDRRKPLPKREGK